MKTAQVVRLPDPPQHTRPLLPPGIASALRSGVKTEIPEEGPISTRPDRAWNPPPATAAQLVDASRALEQFEAWLAPAPKAWLVVAMKALFGRWYVPDYDVQTHAMIAADTLDAISEFPKWAIQEVRRDWIANKDRRPDAADLVRACRELVAEDAVTLHNLRRFIDPEEQRLAKPRQAERERREAERQASYTRDREERIAATAARERRFAEARAWRAENPITGDQRPPARPTEREPASQEQRRQAQVVADALATFRLPDENDPRVQARLREMGVPTAGAGGSVVPTPPAGEAAAPSVASAAQPVIDEVLAKNRALQSKGSSSR